MQAKKPLTDRAIRALPPTAKGKRRLVWDAIVPGLAVRVTDRGQRSFVLVTRYPGSRHPAPRALGTVGAILLEDARSKAREWLKLISAGVDPAHAAADAAQNTLRAICEEYLARDGSKLRSVDRRRRDLGRLVYPILGARPIAEIRRSDIVRLLDKIEDENGPVMADRTLAALRRVMNYHASRSDDFRSPIVRGMARTKPHEHARERTLTDDELRAVWRAADGSLFGSYIKFLLLTAARRNEAAQMERAELSGAEWTLPASRNKTNVDLVRPLSAPAQAILADLPQARFVFTRNGRTPFGSFTKLKEELDKASGVTDWTLHDLRRTARSLMSRAGVPSDHAERCLGHVIGGVRGTYDRHAYAEEKRLAFEALASLIERIVDPQPNIVPIRGER